MNRYCFNLLKANNKSIMKKIDKERILKVMRNNFGGGMPNMQQLMKQAQKMQKQMAEAQAELEAKEITATAGGGAVEIVITGKKEVKAIKIDPEIVDPDDVESLEDLVLVAVNEAIRQADELSNKLMGQYTGMPGAGGLF